MCVKAVDGGGSRARSYDLHESDAFWTEHMGSAFHALRERRS